MKILFLLFIAVILSTGVYAVLSLKYDKKKKSKKPKLNSLGITACVALILLGLITLGMYKSATQPDMQCYTSHPAASQPPASLKTARDYFMQGDYNYEIGNCRKAIADYTQSITLDPNYPQAYNNRAYTNMRMRNYKDALLDLDKAIQLNPNYIQALMNRGDIHNYYYQIDRKASIADYQKVIALGGTQKATNVCGHLFLARHNGWTLGAYIDYFKGLWQSCN